MAFAADIKQFEAGLLARVQSGFQSVSESYRKRRDFNRTIRELRALDDRELLDLGLGRSEIVSIAYDTVYGHRS